MDKIVLISTNLAEKITIAVTESPYRTAAEGISSTCGKTISHGGAWNLVQQFLEKICGEEAIVSQMDAGEMEGERKIPALFEKMDGVWLNMQRQSHQKEKKQEMNVFTMYEGGKSQE